MLNKCDIKTNEKTYYQIIERQKYLKRRMLGKGTEGCTKAKKIAYAEKRRWEIERDLYIDKKRVMMDFS